MQGTLHPGALPRLLGELLTGGASGILRLNRDHRTLTLRFGSGRVAVADSPAPPAKPAPSLGQLDKRLDALLRDIGVPSATPHRKAAKANPRDSLAETLAWTDGSYSIEQQSTEEQSTTLPPGGDSLTLAEAIRLAIRGLASPEAVEQALGDLDRLAVRAPVDPARLGLVPSDAAVLALVDGSRTLREVLEQAAIPAEDARRSLFGLLCAGAVALGAHREAPPPEAPAPPPSPDAPAAQAPAATEAPAITTAPPSAPQPQSPPREEALAAADTAPVLDEATLARHREIRESIEQALRGNHFEVLGIARGATDSQVKEAYFRLVKRFHPDMRKDPALADLKKECEALFVRIGDAYEVLGHPHRRARYEAELLARESRPASSPNAGQSPEALEAVQNALLADDAIAKASQLAVEGQYWDAIQLLEPAIPRMQSKRLQHEAQVLLARAYMRNPKWVRRGEELLQTVVREDPSWVDAYFVLGTIYRGNGLKSRAITMFRKVLELKPNHRPAAAEIRALGEPPQAKK